MKPNLQFFSKMAPEPAGVQKSAPFPPTREKIGLNYHVKAGWMFLDRAQSKSGGQFDHHPGLRGQHPGLRDQIWYRGRAVRPLIIFGALWKHVVKMAGKSTRRCFAPDFEMRLRHSLRPGRQVRNFDHRDVIGAMAKFVLHFGLRIIGLIQVNIMV